jgi:hypothetical protein
MIEEHIKCLASFKIVQQRFLQARAYQQRQGCPPRCPDHYG